MDPYISILLVYKFYHLRSMQQILYGSIQSLYRISYLQIHTKGIQIRQMLLPQPRIIWCKYWPRGTCLPRCLLRPNIDYGPILGQCCPNISNSTLCIRRKSVCAVNHRYTYRFITSNISPQICYSVFSVIKTNIWARIAHWIKCHLLRTSEHNDTCNYLNISSFH